MNALAEPFFICLLASMVWAPLVFLAANKLRNNEAYADKLWPAALMIAALPAVIAPIVAALGVSLRPAPPAIAAPTTITTSTEVMATPVTTEVLVPMQSAPITIEAIFEAAAALYLYGFLMFLALGVLRHIWFAYRVSYAVDMDYPELEAAFEEWRERFGVRAPRYAFTDVVSSVCVHGFFRPVILMPEALLERVSEHDATLMVAHEMAHIKRGDTVLFAFCTAVKAVFWFNPFMQRIAAQANLAAEQAADAMVIARGAERKHYARCFVEGLRFAADTRFAERELVPSFTPFDRRSRRERLDAILSGRGPSGLTLRTRLGIAASIAAAAGLAFAQAALAVTPQPHEALTQTPVEGKVTKPFMQRSVQLDAKGKEHKGVDIAASRGSVVRAAGDGKVVEATKRYRGQSAWGKVVVIDHGHGLVTRYAHLDGYVVNKGDVVKAGDPIGAVGSTGRTGGRAHLHFEVIQDGAPIDPLPIVAAKPMPAPKPLVEVMPAPTVELLKPLKPVKRYATVSPAAPKISNDVGSLKIPSPPRAPRSSFQVFKAPDFQAMNKEFTELLGAVDVSADLEELELKVRPFDPDEVQTLAMNMVESLNDATASIEYLSEDAVANIKENMRAAAENAKKNTKTAKEHAGLVREQTAHARIQADHEKDHAARDEERMERDQERMERDQERMERDQERMEREQERMEAQIERELERDERERSRAMAQAEKERERALQEVERAVHEMEIAMERLERQEKTRELTLDDEKKLLALREKAIRQARNDLDKELAEIKRQREKLERAEKNKK